MSGPKGQTETEARRSADTFIRMCNVLQQIRNALQSTNRRTTRVLTAILESVSSPAPAHVTLMPFPLLRCTRPQICKELCVEKIKTIGDCYMCVAWPDESHSRKDCAHRVLLVAQEMHRLIALQHIEQSPLAIRAGIHGGPVVSGIIGKNKFCFDIWGVCAGVGQRLDCVVQGLCGGVVWGGVGWGGVGWGGVGWGGVGWGGVGWGGVPLAVAGVGWEKELRLSVSGT